MRALRVALTDTLAYWTVVDDDWRPVPAADGYLRHLRLGADRAEGTTRVYAGDVACYLSWLQRSGRDLTGGAKALGLFVTMLKMTPVVRAGAGQGRVRSPGRINHVLAAVRELYKHAVADGGLDASVLGLLYEVGDDRNLQAELRPEGSGLRYRATATELLARGAAVDVVKEFLGHASIRSTEAYLHPDADAQRTAVERLGPLNFGDPT